MSTLKIYCANCRKLRIGETLKLASGSVGLKHTNDNDEYYFDTSEWYCDCVTKDEEPSYDGWRMISSKTGEDLLVDGVQHLYMLAFGPTKYFVVCTATQMFEMERLAKETFDKGITQSVLPMETHKLMLSDLDEVIHCELV